MVPSALASWTPRTPVCWVGRPAWESLSGLLAFENHTGTPTTKGQVMHYVGACGGPGAQFHQDLALTPRGTSYADCLMDGPWRCEAQSFCKYSFMGFQASKTAQCPLPRSACLNRTSQCLQLKRGAGASVLCLFRGHYQTLPWPAPVLGAAVRLRTYITAIARRSKETPESHHCPISISVDGAWTASLLASSLDDPHPH